VDYNKFKQIFSSKEQRKKKREIRKSNRAITKEDNKRKVEAKTITPPSKANDNDQ